MENPPFSWYLPGKMGIFMGYVSWRVNHWIFLVTFSTHVHLVHFHLPAFRTRCARNSSHTLRSWNKRLEILGGQNSWQKHGAKKGSLRHEAEYPHIIIKKVVIFKYHYNKSHLYIFNERSIRSPPGLPGCNLADCLQREAMVRNIWETHEDTLTSWKTILRLKRL